MPAKGFRYDPASRFVALTRYDPATGCRLWIGTKNRGYGVFKLDGRREKAPRAAWQLFVEPLRHGECVLHRCDTPACVQPAHLFVGSKGDNNRDRHAKKRSRNQYTGKPA